MKRFRSAFAAPSGFAFSATPGLASKAARRADAGSWSVDASRAVQMTSHQMTAKPRLVGVRDRAA